MTRSFSTQLAPIVLSAGSANGARTLVRQSSQDAIHAVCELTLDGEQVIGYRLNPESPTCGWGLVDAGCSPSLGLSGGSPWVCYVQADSTGSSETLFAAVIRSDSSWKHVPVYGAPSGQHLGSPSLGVFQGASGRLGNVALACYESTATDHSMILYLSFDSTGNDIKLDTLDDFAGSYGDSAACLVVGTSDSISVAYGRADTVFLRRLRYSPNDHNPPDTWIRPAW